MQSVLKIAREKLIITFRHPMRTASVFENWWQVLIFVADVIAAVIAAGSLVMYILKKKYLSRAEETEVDDEKA